MCFFYKLTVSQLNSTLLVVLYFKINFSISFILLLSITTKHISSRKVREKVKVFFELRFMFRDPVFPKSQNYGQFLSFKFPEKFRFIAFELKQRFKAGLFNTSVDRDLRIKQKFEKAK